MKTTQNSKILRHLSDFGSITALEAFEEYGIMHLSSRICDIKKMGFKVSSEIVKSKNRYGEDVHFSRYRFEEVP